MKREFVHGTRSEAKAKCPWAAKIVEVEGGYLCFESFREYKTWKEQK